MLNLLKFDVERIKQSVISVAFKTPLKAILGICIDKTSHQHRPDEYIGFTPSCPPHILQHNCAHALVRNNAYGFIQQCASSSNFYLIGPNV